MVRGRVFITRVASAILLFISRKLSVRAAELDDGADVRGASTGSAGAGSASAKRGRWPTTIGLGVGRGDEAWADAVTNEPETSETQSSVRQDLNFIRWYYRQKVSGETVIFVFQQGEHLRFYRFAYLGKSCQRKSENLW